MSRTGTALLLVLFSATTATPQDGRLTSYNVDLTDAQAAAPASAARQTAVEHLINIPHHTQGFVAFAYGDVLFDTVLGLWDQSRVDKQIGSTASGSGATDLVSLPSTPELFGLALNLGALTQSVSGSVVTFRGNADGIIRAIGGQPISCNGCTGTHGLKNLAFAVSFDLNRQATQQATTNGAANSATTTVPGTILLPKNTKQFSSFNARYDIYNPKDTRSPAFQKAWADWFALHQKDLEAAAKELLDASDFLDPFLEDTKLADLRGEYTTRLNQADSADVQRLFTEYLSKALALARADVPNFDQQALGVRAAYARYGQTYEDLFKGLRGKPQFSAEYTYSTPVNQPDMHNFRFIFASNPFSGGGLLSANAAVTLYGGQLPAGAKYGRLRDFQFAAQFDRPLGNISTHPAVFTLAGYVQYQLDPSVINIGQGNLVPGTTITLPQDAQVLLGRSGTMGIVQAKVTLKLKNSGVKIPIAVSWANRTDLLNATDVRGHIGITYDLDSLFGHQ
jgi:hypothetical protein